MTRRISLAALVAQRDALSWKAADWRHLAERCADQPAIVAKALANAATVQDRANVLTVALREIALNAASGCLSDRRAA